MSTDLSSTPSAFPSPEPLRPGELPDVPIQPKTPEAPKPLPEMKEDLAVEMLDYTRLGIELRNAIEAGKMTPADIHQWTSHPWRAYEFLVGKMEKNIVHTPFLDGLREWNFVGATVEKDEQSQKMAHEAWAKDHPEVAEKLTYFVRIMCEKLLGRIGTYEKVQDQLHEQKEIAATDKIYQKAKEFAIKNPPVALIGGLALFWLGSKAIKGLWSNESKLIRYPGRLLILAAGALGIDTVLRQETGKSGVDWAAGFTENLGFTNTAASLKNFSKTMERGLLLGSGREYSVLNFFHEKFQLNGDDEYAFFNSLCKENPREFLSWYNQARTWKLTRNGDMPSLPPHLNETFRKLVRLGIVPDSIARMNKEQQMDALLRVAEKTLGSFKNDPDAEGMDPVAYLEERYVTGDYFTRVYDEWAKEWTAKHGAAGAYVLVSAKEYAETMKKNVAKNPLTMLDIFLIHLHPQDFDKLSNYGPGGKTLKEIYAKLTELTSKGRNLAYEGFGRAVNFATIDIPHTAKKIYKYLKTKNVEELNRLGITQESIETWTNNFIRDVQEQTEAIKSGAQEKYRFTKDSEMWKFLEENLGIYGEKVGDIIFLTDDAIMMVWDKVIIPARDGAARGARWVVDQIGGEDEKTPQNTEGDVPSPVPDVEIEVPPPTEDKPKEAPPPADDASPFPGDPSRPLP